MNTMAATRRRRGTTTSTTRIRILVGGIALLGCLASLAPLGAGTASGASAQAATPAVARTLSARLAPVGGSGTHGTATLTSAGSLTTVTWQLRGLAPGAGARAFLHAGTCALPSASQRALALLRSDARGAVWTSTTTAFALPFLGDGSHLITLVSTRWPYREIACGSIQRS